MSNQQSNQPSRRWEILGARALWMVGLVVAATCGGDDVAPGSLGELRGVAHYGGGGGLAGATVTVRQYYQDVETVTIGTTTTAADGSWVVDSGTYAGDFLVTIAGPATYQEAAGGATVTLDASAVLHAPVQDVQTAERRGSVPVTPLTELVWQLGKARLAGGEDPDYPAAIAHARALVAAHVDFDPLVTPIASLAAATPFNESARHALVLAGLSELAATAATDRGVTVQAINTRVLLTQLVRDAASPEARLDGNGAAEVLCLATSCPLPTGCTVEGPGCYSSSSVYSNTLRARLGAAVLRWLLRPGNGTGLGRSDVLSWVTRVKDSNDPMLFGGDPPEALDATGPVVTWVAPADGAPVTGLVALEVTATDDLGVAAITVQAGTNPPVAVTDTDPTAGRFAASFSTAGLPEGPLAFTATARNVEGLETVAPRLISVNNVPGGVLAGIVVKGPVAGATVRAFRYDTGVRGAQLGWGTTGGDGRFAAVSLAEGYSGPVLIEAGEAGSYGEEAAPATVVLDVTDTLRTIVADYQDGGALTEIVLSPLTSFAVTYFEYLRGVNQGGATLAAQWATAHGAIEAHFGVNNVRTTVPPALATVTSTNSVSNYALVLLGLSELAYRASTAGGGDGGNFGSTMNAMRVVRVLNQDLADGCLDGRAGATALVFGGTQLVGPQATRMDLANALVANEQSATRDATPGLSDVADLIGLLDNLARGGGNTALGSCTGPGAGHVNPDDGAPFDQVGPTVVWQPPTPAELTWVRGAVMIQATATDPFDLTPIVSWVGGLIDTDGDVTNPTAQATLDTTAVGDGVLTIRAHAVDDSGNPGEDPPRRLNVDNTPPVITLAATGFYVSGPDYWTASAAPTVTGTIVEANLVSVTAYAGATEVATAIVTGGGWTLTLPAGTVPSPAAVTIRVEARDRAGNVANVTQPIRYDATPPVLTIPNTQVRDESKDGVTFSNTADPVFGLPTLNPGHIHTTSPVDTATLGPATACAVGAAPKVTKYAYLLDETPVYATETSDPVVGASNALRWGVAPSDDGVGLVSVRYRVTNVSTAGVLLDWTTLPGVGATTIPLHRAATTAPAIPALGTTQGLLRIEFEAIDRLNRTTSTARCWEQVLLAAPVVMGATAVAATNGPIGSGKYGLALLRLEDLSTPIDPVSMLLNPVAAATPAGAGLFEFPIYNPTNETVYMSIDLDLPGASTWNAPYFENRWTYTQTTSSLNCGRVLEGGEYVPDGTIPGCASVTNPGPGDIVQKPHNGTLATTDYGIRIWQVDQGTQAFVERSQCAGCSTIPAVAGRARVTITLPPRGAAGYPPPKFWIVPVLRPSVVFQPNGTGPFGEFGAGGQTLTGRTDETLTGCHNFVLAGAHFDCTASRTYKRVRYVKSVTVGNVGNRTAFVYSGLSGASTTQPPNLPGPSNTRGYLPSDWTSTEPTDPPSP